MMRLPPIPPEILDPDLRSVHDQVASLVARSQGPVVMLDAQGARIGPFPPMFHFPQFGLPALRFIRSLDNCASLPKRVREVAILTVGGAFGARFELYAHEIMAKEFGLSPSQVATLAAGGRPEGLSAGEAIAHDVAHALTSSRVVPASTYGLALQVLGREGTGELMFLIGGYSLIAVLLNGFDVPAPAAGP